MPIQTLHRPTFEEQSETKEDVKIEETGVEEYPTELHEVFGALVFKQKFSDVVFVVGEKKFPAHRLILAASSPLFEEMLYRRGSDGKFDSSIEKVPIEVKINGTDADSFGSLLQCIYSDQVEVTATNIQALIQVATKYQVEKLKAVCAEFMEADVNKENVLDLFQIAPQMLGDEEFGLAFIEENAAEVFASEGFLKLSKDRLIVLLKDEKLAIEEIDVFKAVQKWAEAEVKRKKAQDVKEAVKDVLKYIRFPAMDIASIASVVAPSNLLEQPQLVGLFSYVSVPDSSLRDKMPDPGFPREPRAGAVEKWTWDSKKHGRYTTLSNGDLTAQATSGSAWSYSVILGSKEFKNKDAYWEVKLDTSNDDMIGVASPNVAFDTASVYSNYPSQVWFIRHTSNSLYGGSVGVKGTAELNCRTGDIIGLALTYNKTSNTFDLSVYKNRVLAGTPFRQIPSPVVAAQEFTYSPSKITLDPKAKKPK